MAYINRRKKTISEAQFEILLRLARVRSKIVASALRMVFVDGERSTAAAKNTGACQASVSRNISIMRNIMDDISAYVSESK